MLRFIALLITAVVLTGCSSASSVKNPTEQETPQITTQEEQEALQITDQEEVEGAECVEENGFRLYVFPDKVPEGAPFSKERVLAHDGPIDSLDWDFSYYNDSIDKDGGQMIGMVTTSKRMCFVYTYEGHYVVGYKGVDGLLHTRVVEKDMCSEKRKLKLIALWKPKMLQYELSIEEIDEHTKVLSYEILLELPANIISLIYMSTNEKFDPVFSMTEDIFSDLI